MPRYNTDWSIKPVTATAIVPVVKKERLTVLGTPVHETTADCPYGKYEPSHYTQFLDPDCHVSRPSLLDRFLSDPRTTKMRAVHRSKVHIAILVKRGKIIAEATNQMGSRSKGVGYSQDMIHAERNVIKKLGDLSKLQGADMYVMRPGFGCNADKFLYSQPCHQCTVFLNKCMREYGLKNVYFTTSE